ncbi:hypothetical protein EPO33_02495 [Patescibacteria group bacterium]|nr:MAG: hypothetical protein EPO33_02495 [Patescibacteria group bacterium]
MISQRAQYAVGIAFAAIIIGGLLAADGFFSATRTLHHRIAGASRQMSDFGPPTRTLPGDAKEGRPIVAEPLYVDVRIPTFFDEAEVRVNLDAFDTDVGKNTRIGVEFIEGSGQIRFFDTQVVRKPVMGLDSVEDQFYLYEVTSVIPLSEVPMPANRLRLVLSVPGLEFADALRIRRFDVTARRGSLIDAVRNRLHL